MNETSEPASGRPWTRREFVRLAAVAGVTAGLAPAWAGAETEKRGDMPYRALGRTGEKVSLVGLGGYHVGVQATEAESIRIIRTALDRGINFLDNCWDYNGGAREIRRWLPRQGVSHEQNRRAHQGIRRPADRRIVAAAPD
jgi:hypothetical protein